MNTKKILLCDDDQKIAQTLTGFFMAKGYDMTTCLTGEDALKKLEKETPDLVIMDLKFPGINGIEVTKKIKESNPETKVIILSGFSDEYDKELKKIQVDHVMEKPIGMRELTRVISDMLAGRTISGAQESASGTPKAKLLILEPLQTTATGFKEYFSSYETSGGEYEIKLAENNDDFFNKFDSFDPDVLLISVGADNAGKLSSDLVKKDTDDIPQIMVSYGLDIKKVAKKVKEVCLEKGLVKN